MYEDFMTALNISLGPDTSTIWTFSYLGHDTQHPTILPRGATSPDLITIWCDHNFYSSNLHPWGTNWPQTVSAGEISPNHHPGHPHRSLYWLQDYHGNFQTERNSSDQRWVDRLVWIILNPCVRCLLSVPDNWEHGDHIERQRDPSLGHNMEDTNHHDYHAPRFATW